MKKRRRRLSSHEHLPSWRIFVNEFCWVMGHVSIPLNVHNPSKYEFDTKTKMCVTSQVVSVCLLRRKHASGSAQIQEKPL